VRNVTTPNCADCAQFFGNRHYLCPSKLIACTGVDSKCRQFGRFEAKAAEDSRTPRRKRARNRFVPLKVAECGSPLALLLATLLLTDTPNRTPPIRFGLLGMKLAT